MRLPHAIAIVVVAGGTLGCEDPASPAWLEMVNGDPAGRPHATLEECKRAVSSREGRILQCSQGCKQDGVAWICEKVVNVRR